MKLHGLLASFVSLEDFTKAVRECKRQGYRHFDVLSSQEIEGLDELMGSSERSPLFSFAAISGAVTGILTGFFMQWYADVWSAPLDVGGKPLNSWPAFVPLCFILMILFSAFSLLFTFIFKLRLPEPYHPVFKTSLDLSKNHFYLLFPAEDPLYNNEAVSALLKHLRAHSIEEVLCD